MLVLLCNHIFETRDVHAITHARDETDICNLEKCKVFVLAKVLVVMMHRAHAYETFRGIVDLVDDLGDVPLELRGVVYRRVRDLDEDDSLSPFRIFFEKSLESMQFL